MPEYPYPTPESMETIFADFRFSQKLEKLAQETASEGTQEIEDKLDQLIDRASKGELDPFFVGEFLDGAARSIWQRDRRIEPIMYIYDKYYSARPHEEGPTVGVGFTTVMAKISSELNGQDRSVMIDSTIGFLVRKNTDISYRVLEITHFGKELFFNGCQREGVGIIDFIANNAQNVIAQEPGITEIIDEVREAQGANKGA